MGRNGILDVGRFNEYRSRRRWYTRDYKSLALGLRDLLGVSFSSIQYRWYDTILSDKIVPKVGLNFILFSPKRPIGLLRQGTRRVV